MKKVFAATLAALVAACLWAGALAASSVHFTGNTNVRTGPGAGYDLLGSVNAGSTLTWLGDSTADANGVIWYSVGFGSETGWVTSRYAELTDEPGTATYGSGATGDSYADNEGAARYSGAPSDRNDSATTVYGATGDSHVRTGPGLGYDSRGTLLRGQSAGFLGGIRYDDRGVAWYQIAWNGGVGWVSSRFTELY